MFSLDKNQNKKLVEFMQSVDKEIRLERGLKDGEEIYTGAIGGSLTYSFTDTSLGRIAKVKYLGKEIDLTDYDSW